MNRRILIDTEMAALMLGCSKSHVHTLVNSGVLTNHGKRKPWSLDFHEVEKAMLEGRIGTPRKARNPRDGGNRPGA